MRELLNFKSLQGTTRYRLFSNLLVYSCIAIFITNFSSASAQTPASLKQAKQLIAKKKYFKAESIINNILTRNPGQKQALLLMGRLKYRQGKMSAAARYFKRVGLENTPKDSLYEAGSSFFAVKKYYNAIRYLKRVPKRSKAKSLANYFIGVSFVQLKNWYQGEIYLLRAKKAPASFQRSRQQYLKYARSRIRAERFGTTRTTRPFLFRAPPVAIPQRRQFPGGLPPEYLYQGRPQQETKQKTETVAAATPSPEKRGYVSESDVSASYTSSATNSDNHGYNTKTAESSGPDLKANLSLAYFSPKRSLIGQIGGNIGANYKNRWNKTSSSQVNQAADNLFSSVNTSDSADKRVAIFGGPNISLNMNKNFTLEPALNIGYESRGSDLDTSYTAYNAGATINGDLGNLSINLEANIASTTEQDTKSTAQPADETTQPVPKKSGSLLTVKGGGSYDLDSSSIEASASYFSDQNAATQPYIGLNSFPGGLGGFASRLEGELSYSHRFESISLKVVGSYETNESPPSTTVAGNYEMMKALGEISWALEFGISLTASAYYAQTPFLIRDKITFDAGDPNSPDDDTVGQVQASATTTAFILSGKIAPSDWFFASSTYEYANSVFVVPSAERKLAFEQAVPDLESKFSFSLGVTYNF